MDIWNPYPEPVMILLRIRITQSQIEAFVPVGFIYLAYCCIVNLTYNTDYSGYGGPAQIGRLRDIEKELEIYRDIDSERDREKGMQRYRDKGT